MRTVSSERLEPGLTTTQAPFIEHARSQGVIFIQQPYDSYSPANHDAWHQLYTNLLPRWDKYANAQFLAGIDALRLSPDRVPRLETINTFLAPLSGFTCRPVSGYVPAFLFFECLGNRTFPTTITIRRADHLDYLPEPDIFHDVAGHVPMFTDRHFAETLVRFVECAHTAACVVAAIADEAERLRTLTSILTAMARFFWFTIEFGLLRSNGQLRAYGSGLLSSYGEIEHAIDGPAVQRYPLQLEWVINQGFEIHHYQPLLFIVDSFEHLFSLAAQLEQWMKQGKLNHVAPGEPGINEADLKSFLRAELEDGS